MFRTLGGTKPKDNLRKGPAKTHLQGPRYLLFVALPPKAMLLSSTQGCLDAFRICSLRNSKVLVSCQRVCSSTTSFQHRLPSWYEDSWNQPGFTYNRTQRKLCWVPDQKSQQKMLDFLVKTCTTTMRRFLTSHLPAILGLQLPGFFTSPAAFMALRQLMSVNLFFAKLRVS